MPTAKEMERCASGPTCPSCPSCGSPRDKEGQVLQALRIVAAAPNRNVFVYDDLPIKA